MKNKKINFFTTVIIIPILILIKVSYPQIDYNGRLLNKIIIEGNVSLKNNAIKIFLNYIKKNKPLHESYLRKDFKNLYESGLFKNITFELKESKEGQLNLIIKVEELPKVTKISFAGNRKITTEEILESLPIQQNDYYSDNQLNNAILHIKNLYRKEGYLTTKVKVEKRKNNLKNTMSLFFDIKEGTEILVGKVTIHGNKEIKRGIILGVLETKKDEWYSEGKYDEIIFEEDKKRIIQLYKKNGFINTKISDIKTTYRWKNPKTKKSRFIYIDIFLEEGKQHFFGDVKVKGNRLFSFKEIRKLFRRSKGKIFNEEIHQQDIQNIVSKYHQSGYIFARVTPIENVNNETKEIHYIFDIYEGEVAHIESIFISGNEKTKRHVIKRELEVKEGELFNAYKIRRSIEKLMNLQFFKSVIPEPKAGSIEGLMNINFQIEEQLTALISGGAGLGTQTGFSLQAQARENNFLGNGQTVGTKVEYGQRRKTVSFSFIEPWFLGISTSLGSSIQFSRDTLFYQADQRAINDDGSTNDTSFFFLPNGEEKTAQEIDYTRDVFIWTLSSTQRFLNWYRNTAKFSIELEKNYLLDEADGFAGEQFSQESIYNLNTHRFSEPPPMEEDFKPILTIGEVITKDTRDNWLNATRGSHISLEANYTFGQYSLTKWNFQFSKYIKFLGPLVGVYSANLSTLGNAINGKFNYTTRLYYRFYREEIRGWESFHIGKFRNELTAKNLINNANIVGKAKIRHSFEIRFPIVSSILWGVFFVDAGNLSDDFLGFSLDKNNFLLNYWEYMYDFGLGVRLQIAQLPIRLFWSWRFINDKKSNEWYFYNHNEKLFSTDFPQPNFVLTIAGFF